MAVAGAVRLAAAWLLLLLTLLAHPPGAVPTRAAHETQVRSPLLEELLERGGPSSRVWWTLPAIAAPVVTVPGGLPEYYGATLPPLPGLPEPGGDGALLAAALRAGAQLRDNAVAVFGYALHQPAPALREDLYCALYLLLDLLRLRRIPAAELVGALPAMANALPRVQMLALLRRMRPIAPRYARDAVDAWTEALEEDGGDVDLDGVLRPDGGPPVVDFLVGFDRAAIQAMEDANDLLEAEEDSQETLSTSGGVVLSRVLAALHDKTLELSQPLFALLLLSRVRNRIVPSKEESERHLVDMLMHNKLSNWDRIVKTISDENSENVHYLIRSVLSRLLSAGRLLPDQRREVEAVLDYVETPKKTFMNLYFNELSSTVLEPSVDVLKLLEDVFLGEYPDEISDLRWRIEHYIRNGFLNIELALNGFNRFDYKSPIDVLIAILTRISKHFSDLPHEIASSINHLKLYLSFKHSRDTMRPLLNSDVLEMLDAYESYRVPNEVVISSRRLKTQLEIEKVDWVRLLRRVTAESCSTPRPCIHAMLKEALTSGTLQESNTEILVQNFLSLLNEKGEPPNVWDISINTQSKSTLNNYHGLKPSDDKTKACFGKRCSYDITQSNVSEELRKNENRFRSSWKINSAPSNIYKSQPKRKSASTRSRSGRTSPKRRKNRSSRKTSSHRNSHHKNPKISVTIAKGAETPNSDVVGYSDDSSTPDVRTTSSYATMQTHAHSSSNTQTSARSSTKRKRKERIGTKTRSTRRSDVENLHLRALETTTEIPNTFADEISQIGDTNDRRKREVEITEETTTEGITVLNETLIRNGTESTSEGFGYRSGLSLITETSIKPSSDKAQGERNVTTSGTKQSNRNITSQVHPDKEMEVDYVDQSDERTDRDLPQRRYTVVTNEWSRKRRRRHRHYIHGVRPRHHPPAHHAHADEHATGFEPDTGHGVVYYRPIQFWYGARPVRYRLTKYKRYKLRRRRKSRHRHRNRNNEKDFVTYPVRRTLGARRDVGGTPENREYDPQSDEGDPREYDDNYGDNAYEKCDGDGDPDCEYPSNEDSTEYYDEDEYPSEGSGKEPDASMETERTDDSEESSDPAEDSRRIVLVSENDDETAGQSDASAPRRSRYRVVTREWSEKSRKRRWRHRHGARPYGQASVPLSKDDYPDYKPDLPPTELLLWNGRRPVRYRLMKYQRRKKSRMKRIRRRRRKKGNGERKEDEKGDAPQLRMGLDDYDEVAKNESLYRSPELSKNRYGGDYDDEGYEDEYGGPCDEREDADIDYLEKRRSSHEDSHKRPYGQRAMQHQYSQPGSYEEEDENDNDDEDDDYDEDGEEEKEEDDENDYQDYNEADYEDDADDDEDAGDGEDYDYRAPFPSRRGMLFTGPQSKREEEARKTLSEVKRRLEHGWNPPRFTLSCPAEERAQPPCEDRRPPAQVIHKSALSATAWTGHWAYPPDLLQFALRASRGSPAQLVAAAQHLKLQSPRRGKHANETTERMSLQQAASAEVLLEALSRQYEAAADRNGRESRGERARATAMGTAAPRRPRPWPPALAAPHAAAARRLLEAAAAAPLPLPDEAFEWEPGSAARADALLPFTAPGTLADVKLRPLRAWLRLREGGGGRRLRKGPLLREALRGALRGPAARDPPLRRAAADLLAAWAARRRARAVAAAVRPAELASALPGAGGSAAARYLASAEARGDAEAVVGAGEDATRGQLLRAMLRRAAERAAPGAADALREAAEAVPQHGLGAQAPARELPLASASGATAAPLSVDARALFRDALDARRAAGGAVASAAQELLRAGAARALAAADAFRGVDATQHRTSARLLRALLRRVARAAPTARLRAAARTLLPLVEERGAEAAAAVAGGAPQ